MDTEMTLLVMFSDVSGRGRGRGRGREGVEHWPETS